MHSMELKLTTLTYTRLEDNLIRHRGDRFYRVTSRSPPIFSAAAVTYRVTWASGSNPRLIENGGTARGTVAVVVFTLNPYCRRCPESNALTNVPHAMS